MATEELETKTHADYTVGWICALSKEQTAATAMLDKRHGDLLNPYYNSNTYTLGSINNHDVVIACLLHRRHSTNMAANVVTLLAGTFLSVRFYLMVGIGGGILLNKVWLGDIMVSRPKGQIPSVVQWDIGKAKQGGEFERTGALDNPPKAVLMVLIKLITANKLQGSKIRGYLDKFKNKYPATAEKYLRSDSLVDICFKANYNHIISLKRKRDDETEEEDTEEDNGSDSCRYCDKLQVLKQKPRGMQVYYGLIASRNQVIKDSKYRDKLNKELRGNVLCIKMEAARVVNNFPYLVIWGICDCSDSHKNKAWQEHAGAVAAAYAKELLMFVQPTELWVNVLSRTCSMKVSYLIGVR